VYFPLYLHYKISGKNKLYPTVAQLGEEGVANFIVSRTLYIDAIIAQAKDDVEQFVIMGAGFDTRSYGDLTQSSLIFFELDQAKTQQSKKNLLEMGGLTQPMSIMLKSIFLQNSGMKISRRLATIQRFFPSHDRANWWERLVLDQDDPCRSNRAAQICLRSDLF